MGDGPSVHIAPTVRNGVGGQFAPMPCRSVYKRKQVVSVLKINANAEHLSQLHAPQI